MYCNYCGKQIDNESKFCVFCGQKVLTTAIRKWDINVSGVTFQNDDGTSRQKLISKMKVGEPILFSTYTYKGKPAVYILNSRRQIVGNVPAENSVEITNKLKDNRIQKAEVEKIGKLDNKNIYYLGIRLYITYTK